MSDLLNESYLGISRDQLEQRLRQLVADGVEGPKVDFKKLIRVDSASEKAEFCKDLSAMANTDDGRFGGFGYVIIGASDGKLVGAADSWQGSTPDKFSARLTQIAKEFLAPPPAFSFVVFADEAAGEWGAIVIPPSAEQPHVFIREMSGNPAKHDWFVRLNDTTERANARDYARLLTTATRRALAPFELELQTLRRDTVRRDSSGDLSQVAELIRSTITGVAVSPAFDATQSTADQIRTGLATPATRLQDALISEALELRRVMVEEREDNPQEFSNSEPSQFLKPLVYMEEQTRPFVEAILAVTRHDRENALSGAVVEAFDVLAEEPSLSGSYWQHAQELRLYPLALSLYALAFAAVARNEGRLLRRVLDLDLRPWNDGMEEPLIGTLRSLRSTGELFNLALGGQRFYEPTAERISRIVPAWCADLVPGRRADDNFYNAEFVLALEHTKLHSFLGEGIPLPGKFTFAYAASRPITRLLQTRAKVLDDLFGPDVEARLAQFDTNIVSAVQRGAHGRGFAGKALETWKSGASRSR